MPRWTIETRLKQAERIRALRPWNHSTGPRTEEGKARSARNAWKGGARVRMRATIAHCTQVLRDMEAATRAVFSSFRRKRDAGAISRRGGRLAAHRSTRMGFCPGPKAESLAAWERIVMAAGLFSSFRPNVCLDSRKGGQGWRGIVSLSLVRNTVTFRTCP